MNELTMTAEAHEPPWTRIPGPRVKFRFYLGDGRDVEVGHMIVATDNHMLGYVHVDPAFRGRGFGAQIHAMVAAAMPERCTGAGHDCHDAGVTRRYLLVEQQCSPSERGVIDSLRRRCTEWKVVEVPEITYAGRPVLALALRTTVAV